MRLSRAVHTLFVLPVATVALLSGAARAQGKGNKEHHGGRVVVVQQGHERHGPRPRKRVTVTDAVGVTRVVLREQGYEVVRVEQIREMQIVYFRRGNMGRGRGRGPIERMIIRPSPDRVIIERAPGPVLAQINVRLGY
jgi:hypothetical protein